MDELPFDAPPQAVNEQGTKFWVDKFLTRYAKGKGLEGYTVLYAETVDGEQTRLAMRNGEWLYESTALDAMSAWIDAQALIQNYGTTTRED